MVEKTERENMQEDANTVVKAINREDKALCVFTNTGEYLFVTCVVLCAAQMITE